MLSLPHFLFVCLWILACQAAFYESLEDLPKRPFDFIVVGGGTAGNVVANRLSENPKFSVLVLEAGGSNKDAFLTQVPFFCNRLQTSPYNWNYTTAAQAGLNGRSIGLPRGFIIGGSSSINYMAYTRGSSDDYDRFAAITKDPGWSWKRLWPYVLRNERFVEPADHHDTTGEFDPAFHGYRGVNSVSLSGYPHEIDPRVLNATSELASEFPFSLDTNSGNQLGLGFGQFTIGNGTRSSSATSYLGPKYINRPNLHVLLHARVTRILPTRGARKEFAFRRVEFTVDRGTTFRTLTARKELILSAGVVGTPAILLHSGIGDSVALKALGITPLHHLPSVGQNLTDHPVVGNPQLVNSNDTFETLIRNQTLLDEKTKLWNETRTGPLSTPVSGFIGFFRFPNDSPLFTNATDPAAGPLAAHWELIVTNGPTQLPVIPTGNTMGLTMVLVSPHSRGWVTINSTNPLDAPTINPNFFSSPYDIQAMREGFKASRRFAKASIWKDYIISELNQPPTTDPELEQYIRNRSATINHPVGTAAMSAKDAGYGVVDPNLKVKGVEGLRIVDASVFPFIPAAHTQFATYVFGERGADLIKADW